MTVLCQGFRSHKRLHPNVPEPKHPAPRNSTQLTYFNDWLHLLILFTDFFMLLKPTLRLCQRWSEQTKIWLIDWLNLIVAIMSKIINECWKLSSWSRMIPRSRTVSQPDKIRKCFSHQELVNNHLRLSNQINRVDRVLLVIMYKCVVWCFIWEKLI